MPVWLDVLLEIVKITVPALIVFLTVYYLLRTYLDKQYQIRLLELNKDHKKQSLPLRMQAYERLSMFCERISIPSLLLRLRRDQPTASDLRIAMLLTIQQEFEHNITQQVYVSSQLWEIIQLARNETVNTINGIAERVDPEAPSRELAGTLLTYLNEQEKDPLQVALAGIKKEAALLF